MIGEFVYGLMQTVYGLMQTEGDILPTVLSSTLAICERKG
jgi:hypothetical protein